MHAELAEVGVLLQAPYRVDRLQVDLAHPAFLTPLLVVESLHPLLDPLPESALDGGFAALEVARYGLRAPPLRVEFHDRHPALCWFWDRVVGSEPLYDLES